MPVVVASRSATVGKALGVRAHLQSPPPTTEVPTAHLHLHLDTPKAGGAGRWLVCGSPLGPE
jgi:hypothetical protein